MDIHILVCLLSSLWSGCAILVPPIRCFLGRKKGPDDFFVNKTALVRRRGVGIARCVKIYSQYRRIALRFFLQVMTM